MRPDHKKQRVHERNNLTIGGDQGASTKNFNYDADGNIHLDDCFDVNDPWLGLYFQGYSSQPVIVGRTEALIKVFREMVKIAEYDLPVLIQGETGTGKELIARAIASVKGGPFEAANCAFPEDGLSFEDILFGRVDYVIHGSPGQLGKFQLANDGTIFLDNIQCLSVTQQAKLLRVLQSKPQVVYQVGSSTGYPVNVRVISATNRPIRSLMQQGAFQEDLYYRIKTLEINLPALRERKKDIPLLTVYFLRKYAELNTKRKVRVISSATLTALSSYYWPGNTRELEESIKAALVMGEGDILLPEEFPFCATTGALGGTIPPILTNSKPLNDSSHGRTKRIRELLLQKPGVTSAELAIAIGCSERTIERHITKLINVIEVKNDKEDARINRYYLRDLPSNF